MAETPKMAARIGESLPKVKSGTLSFFGDWFGRPMDNFHRIVDARAEGNCLVISFDQGEVLRVWNPVGLVVSEKLFRIAEASRVRWEWYYYGRPQVAENLLFREYFVENGFVNRKSNANWEGGEKRLRIEGPAVELH